jgi:hypothetical protein
MPEENTMKKTLDIFYDHFNKKRAVLAEAKNICAGWTSGNEKICNEFYK